jgi:hypothetical protein
MQTQTVRKEAMRIKGKKTADPTRQEYGSFAAAYDFFNRELFRGQLPPCYITLQRRANSRGYYAHQRFAHRTNETTTSEIALNPAVFEGRTDKDILSTLVHEMAHLWQGHFGDPGRGRYHNREWAEAMEMIGLMPSHTGLPGGRRTGQQMTHYIIVGGPFDHSCDQLLATGLKLNWQARDPHRAGPGPDSSKVKHTCPECYQNAWAKSGAMLLCGQCGDIMKGADGNTGDCPAFKNGQQAAPSSNEAKLDVPSTIKTWLREMAMKYHPDRTLDDGKAMSAVNHGYERWLELFGITRGESRL